MFGMGKKRSGFPGIITGFGGGTFDMDGTEVIPQVDPNEIRYTPEAQRAMNNAPRLEDAPKRQSYWQGGDKFTGRDALAAGLAAIGDGFSTWANGPSAGGATGMLIGGRGRAIEQAKAAQKAAMEAQQREADLRAVGIDPAQGRLLGDNVGSVIANRMKPQEAPAPDAFERTMRALNIDPASPQGQEIMNRRLESMTRDPNDEFVVVPIQGRGTYAGPRSGLPSVFGQGQTPAIVPQSDWDNAKPMGGAGGNASGSF